MREPNRNRARKQRTVHVLQHKLDTCQRLQQRDVLVHVQVGATSLEHSVLLHLQHKDQVSSLLARRLIGHPSQRDLLVVLHTLLDGNFNHLALACAAQLVPVAGWAPVLSCDGGAFATAVVAGHLHLLDHGPHAANDHAHTPTIARVAVDLGLARLAAGACAGAAQHRAVDGEPPRLPVVHLLQRARQGPNNIARAVTAGVFAGFTALHSFQAALVVQLALLGLAEDLIRLLRLLELFGVTTWQGHGKREQYNDQAHEPSIRGVPLSGCSFMAILW